MTRLDLCIYGMCLCGQVPIAFPRYETKYVVYPSNMSICSSLSLIRNIRNMIPCALRTDAVVETRV